MVWCAAVDIWNNPEKQKKRTFPWSHTFSTLSLLLVQAFQSRLHLLLASSISHLMGILQLSTPLSAVLVSVDHSFPEFHGISCSWFSSFLSHQIFSVSFMGSFFSTCIFHVPQSLSSASCCLYFTLCLLWFRPYTYSMKNHLHCLRPVDHCGAWSFFISKLVSIASTPISFAWNNPTGWGGTLLPPPPCWLIPTLPLGLV